MRVGGTGFGKGSKAGRLADGVSFLGLAAAAGLRAGRVEAVVALSSPPLIGAVGAWLAKRHGAGFGQWVMDLNPDEAVAAGWLREGSAAARTLEGVSRWTLRRAQVVIAMDRFMRERLLGKGVARERVAVIGPWSHEPEVMYDASGRERFRREHGLEGKFVVMYAGNHSPCHPLDTLVRAAGLVRGKGEVVFCFVGGGSEYRRLKGEFGRGRLGGFEAVWAPYQPLGELGGVLSAADLHVVTMGNGMAGVVHPCKVYNILNVGTPVLYIGPQPGPVSEVLSGLNGRVRWGAAEHGDVAGAAEVIRGFWREAGVRSWAGGDAEVRARFSRRTLLPRLVAELEKLG